MDSCYTNETRLYEPTCVYRQLRILLDFSRGHERKKKGYSEANAIVRFYNRAANKMFVCGRESTSITIGYRCCGSTWLLGELKAADEQRVFALPRQDKAWRGAERSIGRVFQNQVLFYYGRANKFFQSWPLRYRPPFEIKRSHPVELSWFDSVFFEYLSTVRGKSSRENFQPTFSFLFAFLFRFFSGTRRAVFRLVIRLFDRKAGR